MSFFGAAILVGLLFLSYWSVVYLTPLTNKFFALFWEDPRERDRKTALKRLKESHVDGHLPEETAVLITSKEFNATEEELMKVAGMFKPSDLRAVLRGGKTPVRALMDAIEKSMSANMRRRK